MQMPTSTVGADAERAQVMRELVGALIQLA